MTKPDKTYDAVISFAGQDRSLAEELAGALKARKVAVFYDGYEKASLWGKNLYTHLSDVYQNRAHYCVMLLSEHYAKALWTNHEREAAQARAFLEHKEYILPVRLDETKIVGMLPTICYLRWPPESAETIADAVFQKLGKDPSLVPTLPAHPDVVTRLSEGCDIILEYAYHFNGGGRKYFFFADLVMNYYTALQTYYREGTLTRNIDRLVSNLPRKADDHLDEELCQAALDRLVARGLLTCAESGLFKEKYEITVLGKAQESERRIKNRPQ